MRHDGQSLNAAVRYDGSIVDQINGQGGQAAPIVPHPANLNAPQDGGVGQGSYSAGGK